MFPRTGSGTGTGRVAVGKPSVYTCVKFLTPAQNWSQRILNRGQQVPSPVHPGEFCPSEQQRLMFKC